MNRYTFTDGATRYTRITKREAFKRFASGLDVVLCPVKLRPGFPFAPHCTIHGSRLALRIQETRRMPGADRAEDGEIVRVAWSILLNEFAHFNLSSCASEVGTYAAYYIAEEKRD